MNDKKYIYAFQSVGLIMGCRLAEKSVEIKEVLKRMKINLSVDCQYLAREMPVAQHHEQDSPPTPFFLICYTPTVCSDKS